MASLPRPGGDGDERMRVLACERRPVTGWSGLRGGAGGRGGSPPASPRVTGGATRDAGGWAMAWGLAPLLLAWLGVGIALAVVDLREHRLPNALTLPMLVVTPMGLALAWWLDGSRGGSPEGGGWLGAGIGAATWLGGLGLLWLVSAGRAMGLGDVKLAPSLGATLGWIDAGTAVAGLVLAFVIGALVAVALLATRRIGRRDAIPFGPFLLLGAALALPLGAAG